MNDVRIPDVLADRLGYLLKHAYHRLGDELGAALAPYRLLPRELGVMAVIAEAEEQPSQLEIAARLGVDRTTMVGVIDVLEEKGYVARRRSDLDRRRNVVTLTSAGEACRAAAERARERVEREFLAPLDPETAETLTEALLVLTHAHAGGGGCAGPGD